MLAPKDFDNSRLSTYELCPMKYHLRYHLNLAEPKHLNTRFSTHLIHDPLTNWYLHGPDYKPSDDQWQEWLNEIKITPEEAAIKANAVYSWENAQRCFQTYTSQFAADHETYDVLGIENYVIDSSLGFGSKPDVSARDKRTGERFTFELKFSDWDFILEASTMNPQFLGQVNNTKGTGCIVTLIQPVGTKWSKFNCVREIIVPTKEEIAQWRLETRFKIENVKRSYSAGVWPKHTPHACTSYGGCFFVGFCTANQPKEMLDRMPRQDDPLSYLGGGQTK